MRYVALVTNNKKTSVYTQRLVTDLQVENKNL